MVIEAEEVDQALAPDMSLEEMARITSEQAKRRGLTGEKLAELMEIDEFEARNLGLID